MGTAGDYRVVGAQEVKPVTIPTASTAFVIDDLARSIGIVLTTWQLDMLDKALDDTKEASK